MSETRTFYGKAVMDSIDGKVTVILGDENIPEFGEDSYYGYIDLDGDSEDDDAIDRIDEDEIAEMPGEDDEPGDIAQDETVEDDPDGGTDGAPQPTDSDDPLTETAEEGE